MLVCFYSTDNDNNKISFKSEGTRANNIISFEDKTSPGTMIDLSIYQSELLFRRKGQIDMSLFLEMGRKRKCHYKDGNGLEFDFISDCKNLMISDNRLDIEYDMVLDGDVISSHKIWILLK